MKYIAYALAVHIETRAKINRSAWTNLGQPKVWILYYTIFNYNIWIKKWPSSKSLQTTFILYLLKMEVDTCNKIFFVIFSHKQYPKDF